MTVRILMLGAILSTSPLAAQLLDSIGHFLHQPVRLNVIVDARGSFINNRSARIMGIKIGLEHTDRVRYGLGYNFLLSPVERDITVHEDGLTRQVASRLRFGYVAPYFSYTFFVKRRWAVSIPVQVGVGRGSIVYEGLDGRPEVHQRTGVIVYEPAM
ncbi:MAG: hypothetical protein KDB88_11075, partial [Flavobacteriales bacterium]|nr:hypothetical protein [Flavobacteriales bacterium]